MMRETQQVRSIWEKLVLTDPQYGNFIDDGARGWANKIGEDQRARTLEIRRPDTSLLYRAYRKVRKSLLGQ